MIPFHRVHLTGNEQRYLVEALEGGKLSGDGVFTRRCHESLVAMTGSARALLTHSCTAALEMAALLLDLEPGDEVILPSFTFVSTANAFVLRRAVPVFVDVEPGTLNIDPAAIEAAITPRTRALCVVHYAGVGCDMTRIVDIARRNRLAVIEDAAQGLGASRGGRALGGIGDFGAISFHETKNIGCGEGGALLVNDADFVARAEILREKGTDRSRFVRGEVDKYTWQDVGSSYLPSELQAAVLLAQLDSAAEITRSRCAIWERYHVRLAPLEAEGLLQRPTVPNDCVHNGHLYHVLVAHGIDRDDVIETLRQNGIGAPFHYVPLHASPGGQRYGRVGGDLSVTVDSAARLVRLPLWVGLTESDQVQVVDALAAALKARRGFL